MPPVIEVDHVTKVFQLGQLVDLRQALRNQFRRLTGKEQISSQQFNALDDVSFSVASGEVLGIIGHNGAGKSTLLKLLAGISRPTRGRIAVRGRVAPLIEVGAGLIPDLTGRENIRLNGAILGMRKEDIRRKFDEIVAFAELEQFIDTPLKRYSSGMRVRLAFSIATAVEAEILIVDEVLAVGDLAFQRKCFDRMESLIKATGRTVLLVSHNIRQVERMCSRVIVLDHGKVAADDDARTACNFFFSQSDEKIQSEKSRFAEDRFQTRSTGDVELVALEIFDAAGTRTRRLQAGEEAEFRMRFAVHRNINRPVVGFGFHTTDFFYLATVQSVDSLDIESLSPGEYEVIYHLRSIPFIPGVYSIRVGVALGEYFQSLFYSENVAQVTVFDERVSRSVVSSPNEGFVRLSGEWRLGERSSRPSVDGETVCRGDGAAVVRE